MHPIALLELMKLVESMDVDEGAKRQFKKAVRQVGAIHGAGEMERRERFEFACHLLKNGERPTEIKKRLIARFNVAKRTADRDVSAALQLRHVVGAKQEETTTNEEAITQE